MADTSNRDILLGEVKGLVQRALDQHDRLVVKLEQDSHARVAELQDLREFIADEDGRLREMVAAAEVRAVAAARAAEAQALEAKQSAITAHKALDDFKPQVLLADSIGKLGLSAWWIFFGALWSIGLVAAGHFLK